MTHKTMIVTISKPLPGYTVGQTVRVKTKNGIPVLKFWRDRLRDAKIDDCITMAKPKPKKSEA